VIAKQNSIKQPFHLPVRTSKITIMISKIIDHDLTSQKWPVSWSPFTVRTTLCLNFLEIPYEHHEVSYPDIAATLSSLGVEPEPEDVGKDIQFTLPAITINGDTTMGSGAIAEKLASLKPEYEQKLFPQGEKSRDAVKRWEKEVLPQVAKRMGGMRKHVIPFVPLFLDDRGAEYFYRTREKELGDLEDARKVALEEEKEKGWKELVKEGAAPILEFYKSLDGSNKTGMFAFGESKPQFVDFCIVGILQWCICARGKEEVMEALEEVGDGRLAKIVRRCEHFQGLDEALIGRY
jgi:glutathione S-transferase